jgi:hypothetical protein
MTKALHFHFYDAGSYSGETQRWVMCNFWSLRDGQRHIGQSQLVKAEEWPAYRAHIEGNGWTHRDPPAYGVAA